MKLGKSCNRVKFKSDEWFIILSTGITNWAWLSEVLHRLFDSRCTRIIAGVQKSLSHVRKLSVTDSSFLGQGGLERILTLMPNVTSLRLYRSWNLQLSALASMIPNQSLIALELRCSQIGANDFIQIMEHHRESLLELQLDANQRFTPEVYEAIGQCNNLRLLSIKGNAHTDDSHVQRMLSRAVNLKHLDLIFCHSMTDDIITRIIQLTELRHLTLACCPSISNKALCKLRNLTKLKYLDLSETEIESEFLQELAPLKDLRVLVLHICQKLDGVHHDCFTPICENFKRLEILNLGYYKALSDKTGMKLCGLKELRELIIGGSSQDSPFTKGITNRSFEKGIGSSELKILKVTTPFITDSALESIATFHVRLEHLKLIGCTQITDRGLQIVFEKLTRLKIVSLVRCRLLTTQSLEVLRHNCSQLQKLSVRDCNISRRAVSLFQRDRPNVRVSTKRENE